MKKLSRCLVIAGLLLVTISGCTFVRNATVGKDGPGGEDGPGEKAAKTAQAFGVPWSGVAGAGMTIIGSIASFFAGKRNKVDGPTTVELVGHLKKNIAKLNNEEEVNEAILDFTKANPKYAKALNKIHTKLRKLK